MARSCVQRWAVGINDPPTTVNYTRPLHVALANVKKFGEHQRLSSAVGKNKIVSDKVGAELCSKMGGGNLETATKNQRKLARESRPNQHEKVWRAPAFAEQIRQKQNSE